jgi:uncharacterized protein YdaU (DUF1376 family)
MAGDKKADTWMPLWIGAYLADTMKLTTLQHGAYLLLLIAYWRERKALADDDEELRAITKLERSEWKRVRPVLAKFFRVGDGVWWHKRVEAEIAEADERSKKAAEKAGRAAQARWKKPQEHSSSNAPSMPQALPEHMHEECPPPSPTPLTTFASSAPDGAGGSPPAKTIEQMTKDELWAAGKSLLEQSGMPAKQCGYFVGKLVKDYGAEIVVQAVRVAVLERPADPPSFLKAACQRSSGERGGTRMDQRKETMAALGGEFVKGASHATGDYIDV